MMHALPCTMDNILSIYFMQANNKGPSLLGANATLLTKDPQSFQKVHYFARKGQKLVTTVCCNFISKKHPQLKFLAMGLQSI